MMLFPRGGMGERPGFRRSCQGLGALSAAVLLASCGGQDWTGSSIDIDLPVVETVSTDEVTQGQSVVVKIGGENLEGPVVIEPNEGLSTNVLSHSSRLFEVEVKATPYAKPGYRTLIVEYLPVPFYVNLADGPPAPRIEKIEPAMILVGTQAQITLRGHHFTEDATLVYDRGLARDDATYSGFQILDAETAIFQLDARQLTRANNWTFAVRTPGGESGAMNFVVRKTL